LTFPGIDDEGSDSSISPYLKKIKTGSYAWTFNTIKKLQKGDLIVLEKKGNNQLCSINLNKQKTIVYLSLLEELNALEEKIPNIRKLLGYTNVFSTVLKIKESGGYFIFEGNGSGHGVGLSQWGAYGLAEKGYNYEEILKYYYSGIEIKNIEKLRKCDIIQPEVVNKKKVE